MIDVLCVRWSDKYAPEYVHKLKRMVERHLTIPHKFICVTPRPEELPDIKCEQPIEDWPGWWQIITLFNRDKPFLFFGLDVVIADNIDCFVKYQHGTWGVEHWKKPGKLNSTVMWVENCNHVYANFDEKTITDPAYWPESDQKWIWEQVKDLKYYPQGWVASCQFDGLDKPAKVYSFHGYPKNHQIMHITVTQNWY